METNNNTIKIFSLNKMTFIMMETGIKPSIFYDIDPAIGKKYYAEFIKVPEVIEAIKKYDDYSQPVMIELHTFLNTLKEVIEIKNIAKNSMDLNNKIRDIGDGIRQACQEVKLIREGKLPKKTWDEYLNESKD